MHWFQESKKIAKTAIGADLAAGADSDIAAKKAIITERDISAESVTRTFFAIIAKVATIAKTALALKLVL